MSIVGLGWGRATRTATGRELVAGTADTHISVDALTAETPENPPAIGEETVEDVRSPDQRFGPSAVVRFVSF
jgi:PiT family inorganic phosphate transporter